MRHISADPRAEADEVDTPGAPEFVRMVGPSRVSISFVMVRGKYFFSCVMQVQAADLKQCCRGKAVRPSDEVASGEVAERNRTGDARRTDTDHIFDVSPRPLVSLSTHIGPTTIPCPLPPATLSERGRALLHVN